MRLPIVGAAFCAALALAVPGSVRAQVDQLRSFEVASVRLSDPQTPVSERITDTRVDLIKTTLRGLLWMAFEIDPFCCRDRIPGAEPLGGVLVDIQVTLPAGATRKQVPEMTMPEFAALLSTNTGRPVLDRTNLAGVYAFSIELPPDAWQVRMNVSAGITTARDGMPLNEPVSVSIPRGVERLGLKLEPRRIPVDTIVIDRIERTPSDN